MSGNGLFKGVISTRGIYTANIGFHLLEVRPFCSAVPEPEGASIYYHINKGVKSDPL